MPPKKNHVWKGILKKPAAKAFPCPKGKAKAKGKKQKSTLTKGDLAKLGKLSLDERVKKVSEENPSPEEAALALKDSLTKDESAKMWSKHQTYLKAKPEERSAHEQLTKKEKGLEVVLWFLKHKKGMFFHTEASKEASETLTKGEKWVSEMKMLQEFSQEEFTMHLNSGRILWRSDPWTPGVYNYCDQGDQSKQTVLKRKNKVTAGQEMELETEEDEKEFLAFWGKGALASMQEAEVAFKGQGALTKGKKDTLPKGKGKGMAKSLLALTNGEDENSKDEDKDKKTPEEEWADCLTKAQKSKEQLRVAMANLQEALDAATAAGRTSKQDRKDATLALKEAQEWEQKLKAITSKSKGGNVESAKQNIIGAVAATNKIKKEVKEFRALANRSFSKTSKN